MDNSKSLLIITAVVVLLIFLVRRRKWKKEIFTGIAPGNLGMQAVHFFEQFLGFLPKIGAEGKKGATLLDGSVLMQGGERGAYVVSERGGLLTYLGLSVYFSMNPADRHFNNACENLMFFIVRMFIRNETEAKGFFSHLAGGVLALEEEENVIETSKLRFRCSVERNYSQSPVDEVPEALKHIKEPVVFILEVMPVEIRG